MSRKLLIVESPTKAKKLKEFLKGFEVKATYGHLLDLPERELGVDLNDGFRPSFVPKSSRAAYVLNELKKNAKNKEVYLATDPDREGFAIATHLYQELKSSALRLYRAEFREITKDHVLKQLSRAIPFEQANHHLYEAYLARRISDRLVGYLISPLACRALAGRYSAGRVQSAALKLVVDREREIRSFKPEPYWVIWIKCEKEGQSFHAFFDHKGLLKDRRLAEEVLSAVSGTRAARVTEVQKKRAKKVPPPPFTTSTLQQAASSRLGLPPERTMACAQRLFELGWITYHRTDSTRLSEEYVSKLRDFIAREFGSPYLPKAPRIYRSSKTQADAHEAIRPTRVGMIEELLPELRKEGVGRDELKLFELIWRRALACQMSDAEYDLTEVKLDCAGRPFRAKGKVLRFDGFLRACSEEKEEKKEDEPEQVFPPLVQGEVLSKVRHGSDRKETKPPSRFTEASLIKEMERRGIGRPSTYAPTIAILKGLPVKGKPTRTPYVRVVKGALVPTPEGERLIGFLEQHYPWFVDCGFTKEMEERLDRIEEEGAPWRAFVEEVVERIGNSPKSRP